jgi:hypothetical protein
MPAATRPVRRPRPAAAAVGLLAAALLLAACDSGPSDQPDTPATTVAAATGTTAAGAGSTGGSTGGSTTPAGPVKGEVVASPALAARAIGQTVTGAPVKGLRWTDANGDNLLVLAEREFRVAKGSQTGDDPGTTIDLSADLYATKDGKTTKLRRVVDGFPGCEFDQETKFAKQGPEVADADGDGVGEVLFGYQVGCNSDISPVDFKVLALEGADKYILRGESNVSGDKRLMDEVGRLPAAKPDPSWSSWPTGLRKRTERAFDTWTFHL